MSDIATARGKQSAYERDTQRQHQLHTISTLLTRLATTQSCVMLNQMLVYKARPPVSMCVSVYLFIYACISVSIYVCISVSIYLCVHQCIYLSIYPIIYLCMVQGFCPAQLSATCSTESEKGLGVSPLTSTTKIFRTYLEANNSCVHQNYTLSITCVCTTVAPH